MSNAWSEDGTAQAGPELRSPFDHELWGEDADSWEADSWDAPEIGHEVTPPDDAPPEMAHESPEQTAVRLAARLGQRDENFLTNTIFFVRHPERNWRPLDRDEPGYEKLASEWRAIRDTIVRPVLRSLSAPTTGDLWVPGAERVANSRSRGGTYVAGPWRFVFHTAEVEPSADGFRRMAQRHRNPPHLWAMPSADLLLQTVPLNRSAFALARPGSTQTNRRQAIQVEVWGRARDMATASPATIEWLAERVLAPVARFVPINLENVRPAGTSACYGRRSHCRMTPEEWNAFDGVCGHKDVPDNSHWDPGGLDMAAIARQARAVLGGGFREVPEIDHEDALYDAEWEHDAEAFVDLPLAVADMESSEGEDGTVEQAELERALSREVGTSGACTFPSGARLTVVTGPTNPGEEHYDPNQAGEPLYDTSELVRSVRLAPNFVVGEFARSGGRRFNRSRISCELVASLQRLRDHVGRPITITSGYRSFRYNVELYEARGKEPTNSQHSSGRAVDLKISGMSGLEIAKLALEVCGTEIGVGVGNSYAHVDVRGRYARWTYFRDAARSNEVKAELDGVRDRLRRPVGAGV
ncbi:MAG: D-Ala-D-Ala carboxypeptidase family metallohydrolase [Actinomycetota bacterium]|nr:D-Ala-D-Ala carboxypeptidase family metallohydrolase [Actinomycetota bacterium]